MPLRYIAVLQANSFAAERTGVNLAAGCSRRGERMLDLSWQTGFTNCTFCDFA